MMRISFAVMGVAALIAQATPAIAKKLDSPPEIFGVPLGADIAAVEAMAGTRGVVDYSRPNYCDEGTLCLERFNIENLPETDFLSALKSHRKTPEKRESFSYAFTGPANVPQVWSAGSDQEFGTSSQPSSAAPLLSDVVAELRNRFGAPAIELAHGGSLPSRNLPMGEMWWVWDSSGNPVAWSDQVRRTCYSAMLKANVAGGKYITYENNPVATDPQPFLLARQGNCATMVRAVINYDRRGLVYNLSVKAVDFKRGHDAQFYTNAFVAQQRAAQNSQRSARNKPDF